VKPAARARVAWPLLLAPAAAEAGVRLLSRPELRRPLAPAPRERYFTPEQLRRAKRFARGQALLGALHGAVQLALLAALVQRERRLAPPGERAVERTVQRAGERAGATAAGRAPGSLAGAARAGAGLALALRVAPLPLAALARRRALRAGLITQSWRGWLADLGRAAALESAFAAALASAAVALSRRWPRCWWAPAAGLSWALGAALAALAPVLLDPLFNAFAPLAPGPLRDELLALAERAGVRVRDVLTVDASRRTTAVNAYVAGIGPTRRLVLFDTLLERFEPDEVSVVIAHELAHVRFHDVRRALAQAALTAAPAALAVQRLSAEFLPGREGSAAAFPGLALAGALVSAPVALVSGRLSRALERRADRFSLELSRTPRAFISFERKVALQNLADPAPARWRALLSSHPPTLERIAMAERWLAEASVGTGASQR
jgi:STE24 endopeptidase